MRLIKLTRDGVTKNNIKWEIGKTISIDEKLRRPELCTDGVLHAYRSLEQALAMKIKHLYDSDVGLKIYEVEGDIVAEKYDQVGCYELTPIRELSLPDWYLDTELRLKILTRFTCYCALEVIDIFEDRYPNDDGPRMAIEEALKYGTDEFNADTTYAAFIHVHNIIYTYIVRAVAASAYVAALAARAAVNAVANGTRAVANTVVTAAYTANAVGDAVITDYHINVAELMQKAIRDFT